jgi:hypothetical protein
MHAVRIDEILLRRGGNGLAKVIAPPIPAHQENALGRPFGFLCVNVPRTPQIDSLAAEVEAIIERSYSNGSLRPGQTQEQYFEETVAKARAGLAAGAASARIKIDPSLMIITLACVAGSQIFITRHGQAEAYLIRRRPGQPAKTVDIFRGYGDDAEKDQIMNDLIVGSLADDDLILLASKSLFDAIPVPDLVESIEDSEPAAVAARIRSLIISSPGKDTVAGCLMRLSPVRPMFRAKDNASVAGLRTREEEVARTLSPSGLPGVGAFLNRIKNRPSQSTAAKAKPMPKAVTPKLPLIERFNALPTAARRGAIVLIALVAIFMVSLELISLDNSRKARDKEFNASVQSVTKQIELAESTLIYDEARARTILEGAKSMEKELPGRTPAEKTAKADLEKKLASADRRLQHLYDSEPKIIATSASGAAFVTKTSYGFLTNAGADLIALDTNGSATNVATLPAAPIWAAQSPDDGTIYLWLANSTLVSIADTPRSIPRSLDYDGPANPRAGAVWGGRLYVFDAEGRQIWKLPPTMTGFGRGSAYLSEPLAGAGASSIKIDGSVYAAINNDAVRRFSKGKMEAFAASGAVANASPVSLVLGKDGIYLLGADYTIAAWDMNGKLVAQYSLPKDSGKITGFAVDEAANQIIIANDKGVVSRFDMTK